MGWGKKLSTGERSTATTTDFVVDFVFEGFYCLAANLKVTKSILLTKGKVFYLVVSCTAFCWVLFPCVALVFWHQLLLLNAVLMHPNNWNYWHAQQSASAHYYLNFIIYFASCWLAIGCFSKKKDPFATKNLNQVIEKVIPCSSKSEKLQTSQSITFVFCFYWFFNSNNECFSLQSIA